MYVLYITLAQKIHIFCYPNSHLGSTKKTTTTQQILYDSNIHPLSMNEFCPEALRTGAGAGALDEELEGLSVLHEGTDEPLEHRPVEAVPLRAHMPVWWVGVGEAGTGTTRNGKNAGVDVS